MGNFVLVTAVHRLVKTDHTRKLRKFRGVFSDHVVIYNLGGVAVVRSQFSFRSGISTVL